MTPPPPARTTALGAIDTPAPLAERLARELAGGNGAAHPPRAVLDPACGVGNLLEAAVRALRPAGAGGPLALHGIELDPERARRARLRLEALARHDPDLRVSIRCADALDPAVQWPSGAVVANPPWVSLSGRQAAELPPERLERYRAAWSSLAGWPALHSAFVERIAAHCAVHGTSARVLVPAALGSLALYGPARRAVTRHAAPRRLEELGEAAFPGVVEPAALLTLEPPSVPEPASAEPWEVLDEADASFLEHLAAFPRLPADCFRDPGVHTGNAARLLVERAAPEGWPGLREGRDLTAYRLGAPRLGLRTDLRAGGELRFRAQPLERYRAVPVLVRQTADRPIAALHTAPTYFRNSLLACTPPPGLDPAFCVAVLNAPVAARWHRARHADARQRTFPQVKVAHLRSLPFPIAHRHDAPELHDAVAEGVRQLARAGADFERRARALEARIGEAFGG